MHRTASASSYAGCGAYLLLVLARPASCHGSRDLAETLARFVTLCGPPANANTISVPVRDTLLYRGGVVSSPFITDPSSPNNRCTPSLEVLASLRGWRAGRHMIGSEGEVEQSENSGLLDRYARPWQFSSVDVLWPACPHLVSDVGVKNYHLQLTPPEPRYPHLVTLAKIRLPVKSADGLTAAS